MCNEYGVWINKTKHSGFDLMLFNRLCESWRTSPESWHLSRIYNTITVISHTITHGEHLLRVGTVVTNILHQTHGEHLLRVGA